MTGSNRWKQSLAVLLFVLSASELAAAPPLTLIQDVLYKADGSKFEGIAFIQWKNFEASDLSTISMNSMTARIVNGSLRVQLVPTTTATSGSHYQVKYNSDGRTQFTEIWIVPPSTAALKLRDVRSTVAPGAITSPSGPSAITDVTGLRQELDARAVKSAVFVSSRAAIINANGAVESAAGDPASCLRVDGTSGPCGSAGGVNFRDAEAPAGAQNGVNLTYSLVQAPNPVSSLAFYRNGVLQLRNTDFALAGNVITIANGGAPVANDKLQAWYRTSTGDSILFVDGEAPGGARNGANVTFVLTASPSPAASLQLYRNGILMKAGEDYNLSGNTLTFINGVVPQVNDILQASYRR